MRARHARSVPKIRVVPWFAHGLKIMNQGLICLGFHPPAQGAFCEPGFEPGTAKMKTGTLLGSHTTEINGVERETQRRDTKQS